MRVLYLNTNNPKLTLRADIKLSNVEGGSSGYSGALIRLKHNSYYEDWFCTGNGTDTLVLTWACSDFIDVYIGLYNAKGTVWFDGVQLTYSSNSSEGFTLSDFNSVENGSFENGLYKWLGGYYPLVASGYGWSGSYGLWLINSDSVYQDVPVYGGESLTFSGMVYNYSLIEGARTYFKLEFLTQAKESIPGAEIRTGYINRLTDGYIRLTNLAVAPANARYCRIHIIKEGTGQVYFDDIKLITRNTEKYIYDTLGNYILTKENAAGKQSNYTYDQNTGAALSFTDPANHITYYTYDVLQRLIEVTDPISQHAYYEYDPASNITATRDPRSSGLQDNTYRVSYAPNSLNDLSSLTDPLNNNIAYTYDRSGNLTKINLPNGLEQNFTYNNANLLTRKSLDAGKYFDYTYDEANNLTRVRDQDGKNYDLFYDNAGRPRCSQDTFYFCLDYTWDNSNNLSMIRWSNYTYSGYSPYT